MLEAVARGFLSRDYRVEVDGEPIVLNVSSWRESARFTCDGQRFRVWREGFVSGAFRLDAENESTPIEVTSPAVVTARKPSAFEEHFEVDWAGRIYSLRRLSFWRRDFGLFDGVEQVGTVRSTGWGRRFELDLPPSWPAKVQISLLWLVVLLWNRRAAAA
ncbi:MAG: hypothetical protein AAGC60_14050 [Acidobacteriota bacterium]